MMIEELWFDFQQEMQKRLKSKSYVLKFENDKFSICSIFTTKMRAVVRLIVDLDGIDAFGKFFEFSDPDVIARDMAKKLGEILQKTPETNDLAKSLKPKMQFVTGHSFAQDSLVKTEKNHAVLLKIMELVLKRFADQD